MIKIYLFMLLRIGLVVSDVVVVLDFPAVPVHQWQHSDYFWVVVLEMQGWYRAEFGDAALLIGGRLVASF